MSIKKSLIFCALLISISGTVAKAEVGDFYYGDVSNLTRVKRADVKSQKQILKTNLNSLYFQVSKTKIIKYKEFNSIFATNWAKGSALTDAYAIALSDDTVTAPSDIITAAAAKDQTADVVNLNTVIPLNMGLSYLYEIDYGSVASRVASVKFFNGTTQLTATTVNLNESGTGKFSTQDLATSIEVYDANGNKIAVATVVDPDQTDFDVSEIY